jgi:hypothetical protein
MRSQRSQYSGRLEQTSTVHASQMPILNPNYDSDDDDVMDDDDDDLNDLVNSLPDIGNFSFPDMANSRLNANEHDLEARQYSISLNLNHETVNKVIICIIYLLSYLFIHLFKCNICIFIVSVSSSCFDT